MHNAHKDTKWPTRPTIDLLIKLDQSLSTVHPQKFERPSTLLLISLGFQELTAALRPYAQVLRHALVLMLWRQ